MTPPNKIVIKSDGNVLEFVGITDKMYCYKYTKSKTKKLSILKLSETELDKLIKTNHQ